MTRLVRDSVFVLPPTSRADRRLANWIQLADNSALGPLVFGLEADIQGSGLKDDRTNINFRNLSIVNYGQKLDWFGTARARIGLANGPVLAYVTGGVAYGGVNETVSQTLGGAALPTFASGRTEVGWTIGSGIEAALSGNWTGKIEYLYIDLGGHTDIGASPFVRTNLLTEVKENIFRAGLNYRIGGTANYRPVVVANWAGFYLGGNLGSATGRDRSSLNLIAAPAGLLDSFNLAPDGIIGGAQAGYNWQVANWVLGLEADFQGSSQKDNKTCVLTCGAPAAGGASAAYDATLPWLGTVRGRFGYSVGSTLFYVTGGYAYGDIKTKFTTGGSTTTFEAAKSGWTAGAGIESPFTLLGLLGPNWTTKPNISTSTSARARTTSSLSRRRQRRPVRPRSTSSAPDSTITSIRRWSRSTERSFRTRQAVCSDPTAAGSCAARPTRTFCHSPRRHSLTSDAQRQREDAPSNLALPSGTFRAA